MQAEQVVYHPIGLVQNEFNEPNQPDCIRAEESRIVLEPNLTEGLHGLEPGQELMVVFHLHLSQGYALMQHPRRDLDRPARGVFALRSPNRPNPIGVTTVQLVAIDGNILRVQGLDALNGTPVLDLKPDN